MSPEVAAISAELHRLATSTSPDADRCADALAALVEPLAPTPDQLVAWLEGWGWVRVRASGAWQVMLRGPYHLDVPQLEHAPDYARCVGHLLDDVAAVEHSRRSREVIDLWAWMRPAPVASACDAARHHQMVALQDRAFGAPPKPDRAD